jgi:hypothetical protein
MFAALVLVLGADPLRLPEPIIDAGEVRIGPPLVRRFSFTNTGGEPLTITDVRTGCGCLAPTLRQRVYQPGERGDLAVEVNTLSQPAGPHVWRFSLAYRCGETTGEQPLELAARLTQEIEISPAAIAFRGDNPPPTVVTITDRRPRPLHVVTASASSPKLRTEIIPAGVRLTVAADAPAGQSAEALVIETDDPDYREIKLPVTIDRKPKTAVTALPNRATLVAGSSAIVQLRAEKPVEVQAIEASVPVLTCRWAAGPGDRATVRIGLDRAKWDGRPFTAEVRVQLKAPAGESVVIPVSVRLVE